MRILLNITTNAVKFSKNGNKVQIKFECVQETFTHHLIRIKVTDSGRGIPKEKLSDVLNAFTQVDALDTRAFGGVGLGLSIVSELLQLMNGSMCIDSKEGVGTTLTVELPLLKGPQPGLPSDPIANSMDEAQKQLRGKKVLVAEDNPVNQRIVVKTLDRLGCEALLACDGEEAVALTQKNCFDFCLLDIQMPNLDGIGTLKKIQSLKLDHAPIAIAFTAHATKEDKERYLSQGFEGYLCKPLRKHELAIEFMRCLALRKTQK